MYITTNNMPYEEYFNPLDDDRNSDDVKIKNSMTTEIKRGDKNYQKIVKPFFNEWTDGKYYKNVTIECYGSGQVGSRIRNAVTGQYTPYLVGSVNEDLFFTVSDCVGRNGRKDPLQLYYDTPEQYENHQFIILRQEIKQKWYAKNFAARSQDK